MDVSWKQRALTGDILEAKQGDLGLLVTSGEGLGEVPAENGSVEGLLDVSKNWW